MSALSYDSWPRPIRELARAVDSAVSAARDADAGAFAEALDDLARADREQLAVLLGDVTRELLERSHPDGLDSEDAQQVLDSACASAVWYVDRDEEAFAHALVGALGMGDLDEQPTARRTVVLAHGLILVGALLAGMSGDNDVQPLEPYLDGALRELMRAQTIELP